jgi:dihydropteroate synthase
MGILNVTPDSFADGGRWLDPARAVDAALAMEAAGADLIDVGGESTRPGADPLDAADELARVMPVVRALAGRLAVPLSIDTYKSAVAREALDAGAAIVNDVSGLRYDAGLARVVAERRAGLVLMHTRGRSREMYQTAVYQDLLREVAAELESSLAAAVAAGVSREAVMLDPGIGFAKRADDSYQVLAGLPAFARLDRPLVVGPSRKSFLTRALGARDPGDREWGTAAAVASAVLMGAHIVRVHGVSEMVQVVRVADEIRRHAPESLS